jgi:hypothetical protein
MSRFAQGKYQIQNPEKYLGNRAPRYRSSWEFSFMRTCDTHPAIQKWASEAISIPYKCPITGKNTIYVPDFFIQYVDKNNKMHVELIEVKPRNQTLKESVGKNRNNQIEFARNTAKWRAAQAWCAAQGIKFRVVNEQDLFHTGAKR